MVVMELVVHPHATHGRAYSTYLHRCKGCHGMVERGRRTGGGRVEGTVERVAVTQSNRHKSHQRRLPVSVTKEAGWFGYHLTRRSVKRWERAGAQTWLTYDQPPAKGTFLLFKPRRPLFPPTLRLITGHLPSPPHLLGLAEA